MNKKTKEEQNAEVTDSDLAGQPMLCDVLAAQIIEFEIGIFEEKIFICISPTLDKIKELFRKSDFSLFTNTHLGYAFSAVHNDGKHRRVIYLKKWNLAVFIHEAYHITKYILDQAGIEDHETGAYLIEYIYKETLKLKVGIKRRQNLT